MYNAGDKNVDEIVYIPFNTYDADGASVTVTDLVAGDVKIHKDGSITQRTSSVGITVSIDFDGITGNHIIAIDTSDDTDAGFFAEGSNYQVRVEGITVATKTINSWIGTFGIIAISNIAIGSAGISTTSTSATLTTGSQTNTYTATHELDESYHTIQDTAGTTEIYYEFSVGVVGVPSSITWNGRLNGGNDNIGVFGYNWGSTSWEQIGLIDGKNGSTDIEFTYSMYNTHVGTGVNAGKVRVRFYGTGLTSSNLRIDQLYVSYANVQSVVGYANGAIWIDTTNGTAGTVDGVNGVADLPVDSWADALTLSASTGLTTFQIISGSLITLTANSDNYAFYGYEWSMALGGQSIAGCYIQGATITGISAGSSARFFYCKIGTASLTTCSMLTCALTSDLTLLSAGTYLLDGCFSGVAGTATPSIDYSAGVGNTNLNMRHYSGGIEIKNIGGTGTDKMSLEGNGQLVINVNCSGGTIAIRGNFTVTDNASGAVTLSDDARVDQSQILNAITDDITKIDGSSVNAIEAKVDTAIINIADIPTVSEFEARTIASADYIIASDTLARVTLTDTTTTNTDMRGTDSANTVVPDVAGTASTLHGITDGKVDVVDGIVDSILTDTGTTIPNQITALNDITVADIIAGIADGTYDLQEMIRIIFAFAGGKSNGGGTTNHKFRDSADGKDRIDATVDADGNRTSVTLDGS